MKRILTKGMIAVAFIAVLAMVPSAVFAQSLLNAAGGFEPSLPAYWTKGSEPSGATLAWATDQSKSMGRSLKITKTATASAAGWTSENMADLWSPTHSKDVDMKIGAWVKTSGVNTNPANDDEKWWISYAFYKQNGDLIGETKLPINQTVATSAGWIADTNAVGETILPEDSYKTIITFMGGKNATGTVWADDFVLFGRNGAWAGQDWNASVGVPTGWFYWMPPNGGNDGLLSNGFENSQLTSEEKHSGDYSLKFSLPAGRQAHDGFIGTKRVALDADVKPGDLLQISVWVKAKDLVPDSAAKYPGTWSVGLTPLFHKTLENNSGFNDYNGSDLTFAFPHVTSFDWTKYTVEYKVPEDGNAKGIEVRLHIYSAFVGTVYFDDLDVQAVKATEVVSQNGKEIPGKFSLNQNYPNPFNPSTVISFDLPKQSQVTLVVYDLLGKEVKTLVNGNVNAGRQSVRWNGDNNSGLKVSSGIYIYRISANGFAQTRKMILVK